MLRSLYLVPVLDEAAITGAAGVGADVVVIDLHEGVPPAQREAARERARAALPSLKNEHGGAWVRINATHELLAKPDLRAVVGPDLGGVMLPRATSAAHIRYTEALLRDAERLNGVEQGSTRLIAVIESPVALLACLEIARVSPRLVALAFGADEYCEDLGVDRTRGGHELQYPRSHIAVCARVAGLQAIDTPYMDAHDDVGLRADADAARALGFHGKIAIAPEQVGTINGIFRPTPESTDYARRIVAAHEEAKEQGAEHAMLDGRALRGTAVERARRLVDLVTAIEGREAQSAI